MLNDLKTEQSSNKIENHKNKKIIIKKRKKYFKITKENNKSIKKLRTN